MNKTGIDNFDAISKEIFEVLNKYKATPREALMTVTEVIYDVMESDGVDLDLILGNIRADIEEFQIKQANESTIN